MDLEVHQKDTRAAYLNVGLEEDIFIAQPEGCAEKNKASSKKKSVWSQSIIWTADPCIYYDSKPGLIVGIYVDDLLVIGKPPQIEGFKKAIKKRCIKKDLGSINANNHEDDGSITLNRTGYITKTWDTLKINDAKQASTVLDPSIKYYHTDDLEWEKVNRE